MTTWTTPPGFLFTATEAVSVNIELSASSTGVTYSLISGALPVGLTLSSNGFITGTPDPVLNLSSYRFVVRASGDDGISDRTFTIDVVGSDSPEWITTSTYLNVGVMGEQYALNNQWVDFQLTAIPIESPNVELKYYIANGDGKLPPELTLSESGKITGFIKDNLLPQGVVSASGGYDSEPYDSYFYDHEGGYVGTATDTTIAGLPKIYQFKVTSTDGVALSTQTFKIVVASTEILRYNSSAMPGDITLPHPLSYTQPLQWLINNDLGTIRANNNADLRVIAYDPNSLVGPVSYSLSTGTGFLQTLPEYLTLSSTTGHIHGYVPYQPSYTQHYTFTINATKTNITSTPYEILTVTNTFTLAVKGEVERSIEWTSDSDLGSVYTGIDSELSVVAQTIPEGSDVKYRLVSGTLPLGLELKRDGSIAGQVDYNATLTDYTISVEASDVYDLSAIEKTFTLNVASLDNKQYTKTYVKPLLSKEKRDVYRNFLSDDFTFDPKLIYRYFDNNFGVQFDLKIVLEFGIEKLDLTDYVSALEKNFYRKKFYFGEVKTAIARNSLGTIIYEVVYVDVVDNMINPQGISVINEFNSNNSTYYPSSITNMRDRLRLIQLPDHSYIGTNEDYEPKFMHTPQSLTEYHSTGYIRVIPLCYALPGKSANIVSRIKLSKFDFRQINFEIDRIVIQSSLDNSTPKYLIFGKKSI